MTGKNNLEGKTEKKEISNIWKTFIPYTPLGWTWVLSDKYIHKYHGSTSTSNAIGVLTSFVNTFLFIMYSAISLATETPDFRKWSDVQKQRKLQEELKIENKARDYFDKYDLNKNGVLDSTEFLNYYNKEKK